MPSSRTQLSEIGSADDRTEVRQQQERVLKEAVERNLVQQESQVASDDKVTDSAEEVQHFEPTEQESQIRMPESTTLASEVTSTYVKQEAPEVKQSYSAEGALSELPKSTTYQATEPNSIGSVTEEVSRLAESAPIAHQDIHEQIDDMAVTEEASVELFGEAPESLDAELARPPEESLVAVEVTKRITESLELDEWQQEQTEALVTVLPEQVQQALVSHIETAEPEKVERVEELVVHIAEAAERLSVLASVESTDPAKIEKVEKIEAKLIEMYDELLGELGIELEEEQKKELLVRIKSGDFQFTLQKVQNLKIEETPETRPSRISLSGAKNVAHELVGRFAVRKSASLIAYQTNAV